MFDLPSRSVCCVCVCVCVRERERERETETERDRKRKRGRDRECEYASPGVGMLWNQSEGLNIKNFQIITCIRNQTLLVIQSQLSGWLPKNHF